MEEVGWEEPNEHVQVVVVIVGIAIVGTAVAEEEELLVAAAAYPPSVEVIPEYLEVEWPNSIEDLVDYPSIQKVVFPSAPAHVLVLEIVVGWS